ncbi:hypothetical protein WME95_05035 [Sorangium sp. So ce327]|uniref:hypothetical protein n=1 Tax=Sorangium sp. So ce327 TaxID=3133301 RepID=UPI003F63664C
MEAVPHGGELVPLARGGSGAGRLTPRPAAALGLPSGAPPPALSPSPGRAAIAARPSVGLAIAARPSVGLAIAARPSVGLAVALAGVEARG